MYHKHLVDDRVRSAMKEGLASQEAARAMKEMRRQSSFLRRLAARIFSRPARQKSEPVLRPQQTRLSRTP